MFDVLLVVLILWVVIAVVGALVTGLLGLAVVGAALFVLIAGLAVAQIIGSNDR